MDCALQSTSSLPVFSLFFIPVRHFTNISSKDTTHTSTLNVSCHSQLPNILRSTHIKALTKQRSKYNDVTRSLYLETVDTSPPLKQHGVSLNSPFTIKNRLL